MGMNSGYAGWSMSKNAVAAYEQGEKPKSKWTKAAMLSAIEEMCETVGVKFTAEKLKGFSKSDLFEKFFYESSWHHTSKFCNITYFYECDQDEVEDFFK